MLLGSIVCSQKLLSNLTSLRILVNGENLKLLRQSPSWISSSPSSAVRNSSFSVYNRKQKVYD